jgi:hypothetical protein
VSNGGINKQQADDVDSDNNNNNDNNINLFL